MPTERFLLQCHALAGSPPETELDADSLIGFFQTFRPDGAALAGLFDDLDHGDQLHERLQQIYLVAGEDRRPEGGRDAYFLVREPPPLDPDEARSLATDWLQGLQSLANLLGEQSLVERLQPTPEIRVLEGIAPKHPKLDQEKSELLLAIQNDASRLTESIESPDPHAAVMRPAYYFVACDWALRDYLMWPIYASAVDVPDPFEPYFRLWRHGVKYRVFGNTQIDLYLPRQT